MNIPIQLVRAMICSEIKSCETDQTHSLLAPRGETVITVLDRGFVYVGKTKVIGDYVEITNARNVRVWGTKNGLGELRDGPKPETRLDEVGRVVAPLRAVIHYITCSRDW